MDKLTILFLLIFGIIILTTDVYIFTVLALAGLFTISLAQVFLTFLEKVDKVIAL